MPWSSRTGEREEMASRKAPLRLLDELASRVSVGILNENLSNKYWRWCGSRCSFLLVCRLTDLGYHEPRARIIIDRCRACVHENPPCGSLRVKLGIGSELNVICFFFKYLLNSSSRKQPWTDRFLRFLYPLISTFPLFCVFHGLLLIENIYPSWFRFFSQVWEVDE